MYSFIECSFSRARSFVLGSIHAIWKYLKFSDNTLIEKYYFENPMKLNPVFRFDPWNRKYIFADLVYDIFELISDVGDHL